MGRKAAHKRNAAAAAAAEQSGPAKKGEDGQEKQKGSTKGERGFKQKERRQQKGNNEWGAWEQLTELGLKIRSMGSDGNCLFRSVGDQMAGDQGLHTELRKQTMDYVEAHEDDFAPFVEDDVKFADYVKLMRKDGTWAGNIELQALSMALKRNICIHRFLSPVWLIKNFDDPKVPTIHLSYHGNEHYNSVRNIEDNGLGPPSEIGISEAPGSGGRSSRPGPKGGKGGKAGKGEDDADVQAVMRGTGCADPERAAEVLKEFRGDVDSAIEFLVADIASAAADEEQAGAGKAQDSAREDGVSASTENGGGEDGRGRSGEQDRSTEAAEGPGRVEGSQGGLEGQAWVGPNGKDARAETESFEPQAAVTSADDVSGLLAPAGEGDLCVAMGASEFPQTTLETRADDAGSRGGGSEGSVERQEQVAPPHENGVQAACQGRMAEGDAKEGAEEGAEADMVESGVAEACATDVQSAGEGQSEEGSVTGSEKRDAACTGGGGGESGEPSVSEAEPPEESHMSPASPLRLPDPPCPSSGNAAEKASISSKGAASKKGSKGEGGVRENAIPRKQHPNKQRNGKAPGRNQQCPCGSKKKFKSCCGTRSGSLAPPQRAAEPRREEERRTAPAALQALYI